MICPKLKKLTIKRGIYSHIIIKCMYKTTGWACEYPKVVDDLLPFFFSLSKTAEGMPLFQFIYYLYIKKKILKCVLFTASLFFVHCIFVLNTCKKSGLMWRPAPKLIMFLLPVPYNTYYMLISGLCISFLCSSWRQNVVNQCGELLSFLHLVYITFWDSVTRFSSIEADFLV